MSLRDFRKAKGASLEAFAEELDLSKRYLSMLETGAAHAAIRAALQIERQTKGVVRAETLLSNEDAELLDRLPPAPMPAAAASAGASA